MDERVRAYIEEKKNEERERKEIKKVDLMLELGLTERVYAPKGESEGYPYYSETSYGETIYYKIDADIISDEEYEELLRLSEIDEDDSLEGNVIATVLFVIGIIIYLAGFVAGIMMFREEDTVWMGFVYWIGAFISGSIFVGFSEVIKLLHEINNK